jgi:hypothetical protein
MFFYLIVDGHREGPFSLERAAQRAVLAEQRGHRVELEADANTDILREARLRAVVARVEAIKLQKQQRANNGI